MKELIKFFIEQAVRTRLLTRHDLDMIIRLCTVLKGDLNDG
jgi:hypothetical protein